MLPESDLLQARLLVVDDKLANVVLLHTWLLGLGCTQVHTTQNPFEVAELHRLHNFDLILLDLNMPEMSGFEVMAALGLVECGGFIPVLAITADPAHKLHALAAGARDFIAKPFDLVELKTRIFNLVELRLLTQKLAATVKSLESLALHDALTGLPNRRLMMTQLEAVLQSSSQTLRHGALMFVDIDHFKDLNDTCGHDVGDVLLQQVGARLQQCVQAGDSVARFGGDEFVVLLANLSPDAVAATRQTRAVAQAMLRTNAPNYDLLGRAHGTTLSVGAVVFVGVDLPTGELLKRADLAMYRAKFLGRNQVCVFELGMRTQCTQPEGPL